MKYNNFLENLEIHRTSLGKGKGVRCNFAIYMYPDGHSNFYCLHDNGSWVTVKNNPVSVPSNDPLETIDIFIDILYTMRKKAKRIKYRRAK